MKSNTWTTFRTMALFAREFVGWALVLVSLYIFGVFDFVLAFFGFRGLPSSFAYLRLGHVIEGTVAGFIGVMLFRGGLQLVKVAVAARAFRRELPGFASGTDGNG